MLTANDVTFFRGPRRILASVSVALQPGKVTVLLGPNGAGKSTLLKLLSGELPPQIGTVEYDGEPVRRWKPRELAQRRAVLPQESHLAFAFAVRDVVMMGRHPHLHGSETPHDLAVCEAALAKVDAGHLAERIYPTLSGGEKQRVQLARVLAQIWEPPANGHRCLLLDEPTANLDLAHQHAILRFAVEWARQGAAVLAVLHDLNLAMTYGDEAWVLHDNHLTACGPLPDVLDAALIQRVFGLAAEVVNWPGSKRPLLIMQPREAGGGDAKPPAPTLRHP